MRQLRDINIRLENDIPAPDWFRKSQIVEYFFARELQSMALKVKDVVKVNVYCQHEAEPYDGCVIDGVTAVKIATSWQNVEQWLPDVFIDYCLSLMQEAVKIVLEWGNVDDSCLDGAVQRLRSACQTFSLPIGKKAEKSPFGFSARLYVRPVTDQTACRVVLVISKGRELLGEYDVCTTFPSPEYAIGDFSSLSWLEGNAVVVRFRTAGSRGQVIYGRTNYDCSGISGVVREDQFNPQPPYFVTNPTFRINLPDLN